MKKLLIVTLYVLIVSACAPSQEEIQSTVQASIAETQKAMPTETHLPTQTSVPTVTATAAITASPSPTPDVRLIDIDPQNLLLQKAELPTEGKYYLPGQDWISPLRNSEIISSWTVKDGQDYLAETGRIDGWVVTYVRGKTGVLLPEQVYDNVVLYSKIEGAQIVIKKYGDIHITKDGFKEIDIQELGDISRGFTKSETTSGGERRVTILVSFSYRNIVHTIYLWGWEKEVNLDLAVNIANGLLEGLVQLPLSDKITFTP